jgi:DNA recombination protein RmuC
VSVRDDEGRAQRPDLLVALPGGKSIVVDAKAPLQGYLDAMDATADEAVSQALDRHVMQVRAHIRTLSSKAYWDQFADAPDFVVMFLPGESFLGAALARDASLMDDALANRVLLASPTTLVALLKSAAYGWQQARMTANSARIRDLAEELVSRLSVFSEHLGKVGESLESATRHYNRAVGSFDQRLLATARKLDALGVSGADELALPAPAEVSERARGTRQANTDTP